MIRVRFPRHLRRHVPVPAECEATGGTVGDVLQDLDRRFPGVSSYLIDERGSLRQHVNLFLGDQLVRDRTKLSDSTEGYEELVIMQALSGG